MTDSKDLYNNSVNTDILVAKEPEGNPLLLGNDATIPDSLYCIRTGTFQQLLHHRAAASGRNVLVDPLSSVPSVTGMLEDPSAPPGLERLAQHNACRTLTGIAPVVAPTDKSSAASACVARSSATAACVVQPPATAATAACVMQSSATAAARVVQPPATATCVAKPLATAARVVRSSATAACVVQSSAAATAAAAAARVVHPSAAEQARETIEAAAGSGLAFLAALRARSAAATKPASMPDDRASVHSVAFGSRAAQGLDRARLTPAQGPSSPPLASSLTSNLSHSPQSDKSSPVLLTSDISPSVSGFGVCERDGAGASVYGGTRGESARAVEREVISTTYLTNTKSSPLATTNQVVRAAPSAPRRSREHPKLSGPLHARPSGFENKSGFPGQHDEMRAPGISRTNQAVRAAPRGARPGGLENLLDCATRPRVLLPYESDTSRVACPPNSESGQADNSCRTAPNFSKWIDFSPWPSIGRSTGVPTLVQPVTGASLAAPTGALPPGLGLRATDPRQPTGAHSTLALTRETVGPRATDPRQPTGAHSTLALTRDTVGPSTLAVGPSAHFFSLISTAEKSSPSPARGLAALLQSLLFMVHPDSGCTGSVTNDRSRLINIRPCSESFLDANGKKAVADGIGEMPVIFATLGQRHTLVTFTNVRCVPLFKYTLLSVKQMWREQQISSKFDDALCLDLPASMGGQRLQFSTDRELPTLRALSCAVASAVTGQQISLPAVHSPPPMTPAVPPAAATRTLPPPPRRHQSACTPRRR